MTTTTIERPQVAPVVQPPETTTAEDEATRLLRLAYWLHGEYLWTRETFARDSRGVACMLDDPRAVAFCLSGLVQLAAMRGGFTWDALSDAFERVKVAIGGYSMPVWNDIEARSRRDVAVALRRAIVLPAA